jgi:N-acetylglutamate synthase-like GNAT family acetyltransferase
MEYHSTQNLVPAMLALPFLRSLDVYYPKVSDWYLNTHVTRTVGGTPTPLVARDAGQLVGIALGKKTPEETKMRCVRVAPGWQNQGVGLKLIERLFEELEDESPHCTVAEELMHTYSRAFINRYGFELSAVDKGRYRRGILEYSFN